MTVLPSDDPVVKDVLTHEITVYLDHLKSERGLSAHTIAAYTRDLGRYRTYLDQEGVATPGEVTTMVVEGFASFLAKQGLADSSIGRMVVSARGLHRFWAEEGIVDVDPARHVPPPAPGRRLPKALSLDEIDRLIRATGGSGPQATPEQLCDQALVEVLYGTGARISEAIGLDVDDAWRMLADPQAGLLLQGKGDRQRIVPVGEYARQAISQWLTRGRPRRSQLAKAATPALFLNARGARLSRHSAFNRLAALGQQAGLAHRLSPHTLRHSYATHLIDGGADVRVVQELLGHASVATTQIYTLVTVDHLREVYRSSHPRAL